MKKLIWFTAGLISLMAASNSALAAVTCTVPAGSGIPRGDFITLSPPTISAGADIPVGTVIYQGRWHGAAGSNSGLTCTSSTDTSFWYNYGITVFNTSMALSSWAGSPFGGAVYQTNIPGVGLAVSRSSNGDPVVKGAFSYPSTNDIQATLTGGKYQIPIPDASFYVSLIKIGNLVPGNYTLTQGSLPQPSLAIVNALSHPSVGSAFPAHIILVTLLSPLTVSAQTCTTPDVNVDLGSYDKGRYFTGQGATTPWIDASITLTGCPTFYGFYNAANSTLMFDSATGQGVVANSTNNSIGVRLTPSTTVIDAANGIMAIDSTISGAASGVGIQLGWGLSSQTPTPFNFSAERAMTLPKDGSSTLRVPLSARYIQTTANPTPGKANGKVIFTINYY